jgi:hypothetical protein
MDNPDSYLFFTQAAANAARGIFAQVAAHNIHVQRIDRQQPAAQAAFYPDEQLECFRRLQCTDDTH